MPISAPRAALALLVAACAAIPLGAQGGATAPNAADVAFMSGMITHHAQAILMAGWAPAHGASEAVRTLAERITVSQNDEIALMQRWLKDRGQAVPAPDPHGQPMEGMDHPMLMPGMLTAAELARLDSTRGPAFDRLFLTSMIRHHQGAITMVQTLLAAPGAAQDGEVFRFASDVNADQTAEIDRMRRMLTALTPRGEDP